MSLLKPSFGGTPEASLTVFLVKALLNLLQSVLHFTVGNPFCYLGSIDVGQDNEGCNQPSVHNIYDMLITSQGHGLTRYRLPVTDLILERSLKGVVEEAVLIKLPSSLVNKVQ